MEDHVRVILVDDWVCYFELKYYETLKEAMIGKKIIELKNLFGQLVVIKGKTILYIFRSTVEGRERYDKFDKMMKAEEEDKDPSWK